MVNARIPVSLMFSPDGDWVWGLEKENTEWCVLPNPFITSGLHNANYFSLKENELLPQSLL